MVEVDLKLILSLFIYLFIEICVMISIENTQIIRFAFHSNKLYFRMNHSIYIEEFINISFENLITLQQNKNELKIS